MMTTRYLSTMINKTITLAIVCLSLSTLAVAQSVINCTDQLQDVTDISGQLIIDRSIGSCLLQTVGGNQFFGFKTDNLKLYDGEYILVTPGKSSDSKRNISGPIETDYLVFGMFAIRIEFRLNKGNGPLMNLEYFQNKDMIPIDGDKPSEMSIVSYGVEQYNLAFVKTIKDSIHSEVIGANEPFSHYLISDNIKTVPVKLMKGNNLLIRTSPVRRDCSKSFEDKADEKHEISGPDAKSINGKYKCVNIFTTSQSSPAHYDVDFSNFLDIVDVKDELTIDDGYQALKINKYTAKQYYQSKPTLSFKGQKLAVIYESLQVISPKAVFKLTVGAKTTGGVIDTAQALSLPDKGSARFTLRSQGGDAGSFVEVKGGKLNGGSLEIYNSQRNPITLTSDMFLPPVIAFGETSDIILDFMIQSKMSTTFTYKQDSSCGGTIFGSSGTISIDGGNKTCYWLIDSNSRLSIDSYNLPTSTGCLEIYSLLKEGPIFKRCDFGSGLVLPQFILDPSYLKVTTSAQESKFVASISPSTGGNVQSTSGSQTFFRSKGYPSTYAWSSISETFTVDSTNKSKVLSIADLDLREGEKLTINSNAYTNLTYLAAGDLDLPKNISTITISRSLTTSDFNPHKGYSLVVSQYQAIVVANMSTTNIKTPKNLTSLLLKIAAPVDTRLTYSILNATLKDPSYVMSVIDAKSVVGRQVYEEERYNGSTTSSTLLISFVTTKDKATLPEFKVNYNQLACNKTKDHICDQATRCVPAEKLCKGKSYCLDGTDLKVACTNGPAPPPQIITTGGYSGVSMFFMSILVFALGFMAALYGPDMYKSAESRFRSGQYTTFSSTE